MKSRSNQFWMFDFDGTLVDSESAIRKCYVSVTSKLAPARVSRAQTILIGPTLDESSREILGDSHLPLLDEFKQNFQCEYDSSTVFETLTYPQADRVIKFLHGRGDKMAIATNKRSGPTKALLKYYKWETFFEFVACIDQFASDKTKSDMVSRMLQQYPLFKKSFFVGDTLTDGYAAKNNKLNFVKAKYGYGDRQNWDDIPVHKSIDEIAELMLI